MPSAPGVSSEEAKKLKEEKAKKDAATAKRAKAVEKYKKDASTATVEELVAVADLEKKFFKEGDWQPAWGHVEFDGDACLKNISKVGKAKDGFFVPAGSILPLGAALPEMTVLKYGGYFPAGTSFQGGVLIPLHARMVNILPQETTDPKAALDESLCTIQ